MSADRHDTVAPLPRLSRGSWPEGPEGALPAHSGAAARPHPLSHAARDSSPASGGAQERLSREEIVAAARLWLGTPYVHQASARGAGCDCLGLIRGLYTELLGAAPETPPPYTPDWNERRPCEEPLLNAARRHLIEVSSSPVYGGGGPQAGERKMLRPGQVLIFRIVRTGPAKHCGLVSSDNHFIHAYAGRAVVESWLSRWWTTRIAGVFEFPGVL